MAQRRQANRAMAHRFSESKACHPGPVGDPAGAAPFVSTGKDFRNQLPLLIREPMSKHDELLSSQCPIILLDAKEKNQRVFRHTLVQQDQGICRIALDRPERLNAINIRVGLELHQVLEECDFDETVPVVILTGAGRAFCAGDNLKGMAEPDQPERKYVDTVKHYVQGEGR